MADRGIIHIDAVFGKIVANKREALIPKMDQSQLAKELKINQPALSRIERGESAVNITMLRKLAKAFRTSSAQLMNDLEEAIRTVEKKNVTVLPKKEAEKKNDGLALALGAAALLYILTSK